MIWEDEHTDIWMIEDDSIGSNIGNNIGSNIASNIASNIGSNIGTCYDLEG